MQVMFSACCRNEAAYLTTKICVRWRCKPRTRVLTIRKKDNIRRGRQMREYQHTYTLKFRTPKTPEGAPRTCFQTYPMHHLEHAGQITVDAEGNPHTPKSVRLVPPKLCASDVLPMARGTLLSFVRFDERPSSLAAIITRWLLV